MAGWGGKGRPRRGGGGWGGGAEGLRASGFQDDRSIISRKQLQGGSPAAGRQNAVVSPSQPVKQPQRCTRPDRADRAEPYRPQKLPELQGDGQDNPNNNNTPSQEWGDWGGGGGFGIGDAGSRAWLSQIVPKQPGLRKIRHGKPESYCHNLSHTHRAAQDRKDESFDVTNCQISTELRKIGKTRTSTSQTVKHPQSCARSDMKDKSFDVTNCQTTTGLRQIRHERQELRRHKLSNNHRAAQNRQGRLETLHPPLQSH